MTSKRQQQLADDLKACKPGGWNALFHGERALLDLVIAPEPVERKVIERVLKQVLPITAALPDVR